MSIGPTEVIKEEPISKAKKFTFVTSKVVAQYFAKPAHYIFYTLLTLGGISLLAGRDPSIKFWILLCAVGILNVATATTRIEHVEAKKPSRHDKRK